MRQMGTLQNPRGEWVPSLGGQGEQGRDGACRKVLRGYAPGPTLRKKRKSSHHAAPHPPHSTPHSGTSVYPLRCPPW